MTDPALGEMSDISEVAELSSAIREADLALALIDLSDLTFVSVSQRAIDSYGLPAAFLVGRPATDFVRIGDREAALEALHALRTGAISIYVAHRELRAAAGAAPLNTEWLRAFEIGGRQLALAQAAPRSDDEISPIAQLLGHEPTRMTIGTIDADFTITAVSSDITEMLGLAPADLIGQRLVDTVASRDIGPLLSASRRRTDSSLGLTVHLRNSQDEWVGLCCLLTPLEGNPDRCFVLVRTRDAADERTRVTELEHHLWQIGGIVQASGVLRSFGPMPDMRTLPQLNDLSARQWEVLTRLVRGQRVPTIADELHLSQSTVRNHLSVIFKRFGVRSQSALLKAIEVATIGSSP